MAASELLAPPAAGDTASPSQPLPHSTQCPTSTSSTACPVPVVSVAASAARPRAADALASSPVLPATSPGSRSEAPCHHAPTAPLSASSSKLGVLLRHKILKDLHSTIVPSQIAPSPKPALVWLTTPADDPAFSTAFVSDALHRVLANASGRLVCVQIRPRIFSFRVASQNVANALAVTGAFHLGSVCFFLHSSLDAAVSALERQCSKLDDEFEFGGAPNADPRTIASSRAPPELFPSEIVSCEKIQLGYVPSKLLLPQGAVPTTLTRGAVGRLVDSGRTAVKNGKVAGLLLHKDPKPTYRDIALTPPRHNFRTTKAPVPILSQSVCFRCLSPDHSVSACRDPVRCRNCRRSGHRQFDCKMPLADALSRGQRRPPSIFVPASSRAVHAVPFPLGDKPARPAEPTSPRQTPPCATRETSRLRLPAPVTWCPPPARRLPTSSLCVRRRPSSSPRPLSVSPSTSSVLMAEARRRPRPFLPRGETLVVTVARLRHHLRLLVLPRRRVFLLSRPSPRPRLLLHPPSMSAPTPLTTMKKWKAMSPTSLLAPPSPGLGNRDRLRLGCPREI
jgi:hypothetical protein